MDVPQGTKFKPSDVRKLRELIEKVIVLIEAIISTMVWKIHQVHEGIDISTE